MTLPLVSIYCATYNHADFIKDALDGFVSQETSFPYEVIVHDDASTDGTSDIVLDYASRYPQIHPIIELENQYSKHRSFFYEDILPLMKGKYIARCEGDDFWTDAGKLQMQVSYLEQHESCIAATHDSFVLDSVRRNRSRLSFLKTEQDISVSDMVGFRSPFHTSSIVYRASIYNSYPSFIRSVPGIGDYPLRVYLATCGAVHYFDRKMSVYRRGVAGSWTVRRGIDKGARIEDCNNLAKMLRSANEYSDFVFEKEINEAILELEYCKLDAMGEYRQLLKSPYRNILLHKRSAKHVFRIMMAALIKGNQSNVRSD